jgi:hypothetical protein
LDRYAGESNVALDGEEWKLLKVGLYKLNPVDPSLESAWFQPTNLSSEKLVSKFALKCNLCRYIKPHRTMFDKQDDALDNMLSSRAVQMMLNRGKQIHYSYMSQSAFKGTIMNIGRQALSLARVSKLMLGQGCTRVVGAL